MKRSLGQANYVIKQENEKRNTHSKLENRVRKKSFWKKNPVNSEVPSQMLLEIQSCQCEGCQLSLRKYDCSPYQEKSLKSCKNEVKFETFSNRLFSNIEYI